MEFSGEWAGQGSGVPPPDRPGTYHGDGGQGDPARGSSQGVRITTTPGNTGGINVTITLPSGARVSIYVEIY